MKLPKFSILEHVIVEADDSLQYGACVLSWKYEKEDGEFYYSIPESTGFARVPESKLRKMDTKE